MSNEHTRAHSPTLHGLRSLIVFLVVLAISTASAWAKPGTVKALGKKTWPDLHGVLAFKGKIYVASSMTILAVDKTGRSTDLYGGDTRIGPVDIWTTLDDQLYVIARGKLYVSENGKFKEIAKGYKSNAGMVGVAGKLYVLSDGSLWEVEKNGAYSKLPGDWNHIGGMAMLDGKIYIVVDNGELFEVDKKEKGKPLANTFNHAAGMVSSGGKLYIITNEERPVLHEVDASGKSSVLVADGLGTVTRAALSLVALDDMIFVVVNNQDGTATLFSVAIK